MTDKQIIIDVSDCSELCGTKCHILMSCTNTSKSDSCSEMPNCYYKQLKRKEQECEELKEGYSELTDIVSPYMDDFTGYNEELGGFDIVLCVKELMEQLDQLKAENKHLNDLLNQALKDYDKARQTLTEIKEIAEFYNNSNMDNICYQDGIYEILQKISECEANQ